MIGDKAYDSDRLDRDLAERYGIEMIAPHRGERRTPTQDGRPLRRFGSDRASPKKPSLLKRYTFNLHQLAVNQPPLE